MNLLQKAWRLPSKYYGKIFSYSITSLVIVNQKYIKQ